MPSYIRPYIFLLASATMTVLSSCAISAPSPPTDWNALLTPLARRLHYAVPVAATKFDKNWAIENLPREQNVIENARKQALDYGLNADYVGTIMQDQIEANKVVQQLLFSEWRKDASQAPSKYEDIDQEVRPALDQLTRQILEALKSTQTLLSEERCQVQLHTALAQLNLELAHREFIEIGIRRATRHLCRNFQPSP